MNKYKSLFYIIVELSFIFSKHKLLNHNTEHNNTKQCKNIAHNLMGGLHVIAIFH